MQTTADPYPKGLTHPTSDLIKSIETFYVRPRWLFVRVETEKGIVGWGEATLEGHTEAVEGSFTDLRERFVGWDSANIEDIWQTAYRLRFYRGGPVLMSAISGLDIALWDIKGKTLGVPIWQLLGGKVRNRCQVYSWIGGDRPQDVLAEAQARKDQGFAAVKMNAVESIGWLDSPRALEGTIERVKQVKSIGLDVGLDFHGRVHRPLAKQLAKALEPHHPLFIEEPLLPGQQEEIKTLYGMTGIPIALGERLFTRQDVRPYFEAGCIDIVQPDVAHAGGISETRRIANMAETYDVGLAPHCPLGPIAFAACLQLGFSMPNFVICEMSWQMHYNAASHDLLTYVSNPEVFAVSEGSVALLEGAGLGIVVDEERVRMEDREFREGRVGAWRNPVWRGPDGALREW
ncbi:mandelate racemase/muconate lactonizing protein [Roridomyces roridus]|uniref:Mandelate racemase/muconate lactonizing protein n=1 Tax=Roridomyces roridus TaxID=1738132 RepID=A0AAD7BLQ0_9AGAR|nr:mandelate racemase/muconate lactonizing protein [Roridomyces roridus]